MPVQWGLANSGNGFDYLESLRSLGQMEVQRAALDERRRASEREAMQDAARPEVQRLAANGDFAAAQSAAIGSGDYKLVDAIKGMSDEHRKKLGAESDLLGRAAYSLRRVPVEGRRAAFMAMVPRFRAIGFSGDEMRGYADNLSDDALAGHIALSQSIKDQLGGDLTQARIDDVDADNDRADQVADDVSLDRSERRRLTARGQDITDARGRHSIAVSHGDRVRGQDMTDARGRYSIQVAHEDRVAGRAGRRGRGGAGADLPVVRSPAEASRLPPGTAFRTPDGRTLRTPAGNR